MPELPEVETIRRSLLPIILQRTIGAVVVDTPAVLLAETGTIRGRRITAVRRRGKYLLFFLEKPGADPLWLLIHLRMTGRLTVQPEAEPVKKHTHVRIELLPPAGGEPVFLIFQDTRRFGRLWLAPAISPDSWPDCLNDLGPEPLEPPLTDDRLSGQLERHPALSLKAALLNQSVIAGIGNIYADEILFAAGLAPERSVAALTPEERGRLNQAIPAVLSRAIELCGTTLRDYVDGWSRAGRFQACLMVYGRSGLPCRVCGRVIRKKKLAGRTTSWCPFCQPL